VLFQAIALFVFFVSVIRHVIFVVNFALGGRHASRLITGGWVDHVGRAVGLVDHCLDVASLLQGLCLGQVASNLAERAAGFRGAASTLDREDGSQSPVECVQGRSQFHTVARLSCV
jgi:hypothetical protein